MLGSIHSVGDHIFRFFVDCFILQRNNRKRTHKWDVKAFVNKMDELGHPMCEWTATSLGLDLDLSLHCVFKKTLNVDIQFDPMHLDRAF